MFSLETVSVIIVGYLLGSIPFGVLVAKKMGVDIYSVGSGNPGATNVLRSVGKAAGYSVFILDFLKGKIAKWWMPDDILFLKELPHTATGKIKKVDLKKIYINYLLD